MPDCPVTFKNFAKAIEPSPGELWVQTAAEHGDCRAVALLVLDHGPGALRRGSAEVTTIVVGADPTFDDLLAAAIVQRQISNRPVESFRQFAKYSALVREGRRPAKVPIEESIEGLFLLMRTEAGNSLDEPNAGRKFSADWGRMFKRIEVTAESGVDPFQSSPFANDPEFASERTHLLEDQKKYGYDVLSGKRYVARIPDGPPQCGVLLLRDPKSVLFRYWAREDPEAPGGHGHLLLMVNWGQGDWVLSTDPASRVSLRPLYERLQAAEPRPIDGRAPGAWYDGAAFRNTLIAAPRGGTMMTEKMVLRTVSKWCRLRSYAPEAGTLPRHDFVTSVVGKWRRNLVGIAITTLAAWLIGWLSKPGAMPTSAPVIGHMLPAASPAQNSAGQIVRVNAPPPMDTSSSQLYVLSIGITDYQTLPRLPCAKTDANAMTASLSSHGRALFGYDRVHAPAALVDKNATTRTISDALKNLKKARPIDLVVVFLAGHGCQFNPKNGQYYFLLAGAAPEDDYFRDLLPWTVFQDHLRALECRVVVVIDTCHSGAVEFRDVDFGQEVQNMVSFLSVPGQGIGVLAACGSDEKAAESEKKWGHGALTLAVLEALEGRDITNGKLEFDKDLLPPGPQVTLDELHEYAKKRVRQLVGGQQRVDFKCTKELKPQLVPIGQR